MRLHTKKVMKPDLYEEWINLEVLEKGFQEPLWSQALEEARQDVVTAKMVYLRIRREQLIRDGFEPPVAPEGGRLTRVPHREIPPTFIERHPDFFRLIGFLIAGGLIFLGGWMMKKYGLR